MSKKYAYIHIEKCAGTSLHKILEYNDSRYWVLNPKVFKTNGEDYPLTIEDTNRILKSSLVNGIGGHAIRPYRMEGAILQNAFTFLRDPDKRFVSHFIHQKHKMGIERTFENYLQDYYYSNFITKALSVNGNLEEAKQLIYKIGYVGIMENFEHDLQQLNTVIFNNKLKIYQNHDMQGAAKTEAQDLMVKYKEEIRKCNENDWQLYEIAKSADFRSKYKYTNTIENYANINSLYEFKRKALRQIKNKVWSYL
ncbi:sulfotransferase family 2 domain-containing protein [Winogradskyella sp.]|uniref:sulfotransferase family 2 domain-containing protein n=1 Tax=Winogradskyella sp. TaxID=1883156 RepID=UPI003AB5918B